MMKSKCTVTAGRRAARAINRVSLLDTGIMPPRSSPPLIRRRCPCSVFSNCPGVLRVAARLQTRHHQVQTMSAYAKPGPDRSRDGERLAM